MNDNNRDILNCRQEFLQQSPFLRISDCYCSLNGKTIRILIRHLMVKYTGCTLKLRAVKLLFVIFGRLRLFCKNYDFG